MGVVNEGAEVDALTEVRVADGEPADLGSSVSLPSRQLVQFGTNEVSPGAVYGGTYVLDGPPDRLWWPATSSRCRSRSATQDR